ncbi:iron donor protein CyaY [Candidatus Tisiphia endosymbiont of Hybos culiciformis]|uniref:iron donor protein CyaY n=1 Tax=Candidatus Tisiphia endosymbiont of Hybos culiciformis TaxID=3139331 RepID=UPI003CCB54B3
MDDTEFAKLAEQTISSIAEIIEAEDKDCLIDIDFQNDILTLTTNQGIFVINKHSAAKEIWLSSPISGPYHFYYAAGRWQSKSSDDLVAILEQELRINLELTLKT